MGSSYEDAQREFISEQVNEVEDRLNKVEAAYRELWAAVENGDLDIGMSENSSIFFKLRERFRNLMQEPKEAQ